MIVRVEIPGEPCTQGRPRFARVGNFVKTYDPKKSRNWKATAQQFMAQKIGEDPFPHGVKVEIEARFTCPKSEFRKVPVGRRPHTKRGDADNIAKACMDAATGVLWLDDAQVWDLRVTKLIAAQGEAPGVSMRVWDEEE